MIARHENRRTRDALFCLVALGSLASGCQPKATCFRVRAFAESGSGELFVENFPDGAFTKNALGNYKLAFTLPPRRIRIQSPENRDNSSTPATTQPASNDDAAVGGAQPDVVANQPAEATPSAVPEEVYIAQFVLIDLLWRAEPGTTFADSTQTNAGITYCLVRGPDTVRYDGAGFVYFQLDRDGRTMTGRVESATLYPSKATSDSIDVLGPCRVTAEFVAHKNARGVTDVQRKLLAPNSAAVASR